MDIVWLAGIVITVATGIPVLWQLRRHPRGLLILFFAEMWERFSYYGMRGLLIFYLTQQFLFDDTFSQGQYGAYTSLVYLMPLIGGYLADRYIGTRKAIAFGAMLLVAGHFTMAVEGEPATQVLTYAGKAYDFRVIGRMEERVSQIIVDGKGYDFGANGDGDFEIKGAPAGGVLPAVLKKGTYELSVKGRDPFYVNVFYLALALIIMGVGFLKANISTIVGQLYGQGDPRRDPGFTLYYYGINLGAFWASLACGWLGTHLGWYAGFGAAGLGMALGFVVFGLGKPLLEGKGEPKDPELIRKPFIGPISIEWLIYIFGLAGVGLVFLLVQRQPLVQFLLFYVASPIVFIYFFYYLITKGTWVEASRMLLALILIGASVLFFTLFEQAGSSLNQYAERNTVLNLGGVAITAAQTQSFNSGFILLLAPLFSAVWAFLGRLNLDPNPALKFGLAMLQVGAGFLVLVWGAGFADASFKVPLIFLVLAYLLHTTGELCLSPVGLSQMTKLSPPALVSTVMATWFLASSWAQQLGAMVAQLTAAETVAGQVLDPEKALHTYVGVFQQLGYFGLAVGGVLIVLSPILRYLAFEVPTNTALAQPAE